MSQGQQENTQTPGHLLTEARENLALSQKEIASRLNLREEIIVALDADNFSALPAATYVRGYIRSYARAVDLDADSVISIYENTAEAPPEILPDVKPVVQASSRDKPVKAMTYLITLTLVVLIIAWWQGQNIVSTGLFFNEAKTSEGGDYPGGFTYTYEVVTHPDSPDAPTVNDSSTNEAESLEILAIGASEISDMPKSLDTLNLETSDELSLGSPSNNGISRDVSRSPASLKLNLTAESWIEVYDAQGNKLHVSLAKPGEKIDLTGTPPLSVKLGNARAVTVIYNGKAFDTSDFTSAGVARFKLE